jgi:hypothetical protein
MPDGDSELTQIAVVEVRERVGVDRVACEQLRVLIELESLQPRSDVAHV